ncbi:ATP-dependent DNA helicase [Falsarthrobacter nasiphocae]|uniref:ATP-dependent helicase DinG n=1 Tax=Falsarthrobacter nasiphocae TaxID=189863 RepID=A0AAE3YGC9_9MICC|nr:ATP-dependent DNA helicase [Falsarthrobacter nasiphocae]MDR6892680.1 ATP-dependent DNA helicase DinG [Falsarthrobacter nasiphocae]
MPAPEERALTLLRAAVKALGGSQREGQEEMAAAVARALSRKEHLLVQAGTGTGKSLGYLVPLISHAQREDGPMVIATATLALQSQIVRRDVPRLLDAVEPHLARPVDVALLKGRSNYVCLNKLEGGYPEDEQDPLFEDPAEHAVAHPSAPRITNVTTFSAGPDRLGQEVQRLRAWAETTDTGDRDELTPGVSDKAWRQVSVTAQECLGAQRCPLAEACFSELARERAGEADIVITNHALLAISAFEGMQVLPEHSVVVVDEAHELQDRVTAAVTGTLNAAMITAAASAARKAAKVDDEPMNGAAEALQAELALMEEGLLHRGLTPNLGRAVELVRDSARAAFSDLKPSPGEDPDAAAQLARSRVQDVFQAAERLIGAADSGEIAWVTRPSEFTPGQGYSRDRNAEATLNVAPVSVAMRLREGLFEDKTVILTSATLALGGRFDAVAGDLGLAGPDAPSHAELDVGSPFAYERQGILYTPRHLPKPGMHAAPETREELLRLITASGGAALGLFSSKRAAQEAAEWVRERVDFEVLCQGDGATAALIKEFAETESTCLFGTMTLWQGVDVPGRGCRLVVIDRIPFPRPDDPLATARSRAITQAGGNGFMGVAAASAAIRLAQGVGRLIRSTDDRGVVAVLDSRLATERYGGFLLRSLPPLWRTEKLEVAEGALARLRDDDGA